ncbi:Rv0340 family IniB-related protein [Mycobacterium sp. NPDC006124]|uniref:Rv0340 family IniB-related protein n=1 Tax=Mycobacterium sp. NPDC006124 TaxID=3156729 RepID=UPI0033B90A61
MANSLLDFVMSLVRDPDAAAHYAANPAQSIADANLTDVTHADVANLIPVVAESMSAPAPSTGVPAGADTLLDSAHNVWASGAATAAFDAFDDHLPLQGADVVADHVPAVANVIQLPEDSTPTIVDHDFGAGLDDLSVPTVDASAVDDLHLASVHDSVDGSDLGQDAGQHLSDAVEDHLDHPHDPGFDIFT